MVRLEGLDKLENLMTSSGFEPTTFRLGHQQLYYLKTTSV
jgi:hypothetical protein